ncbi:MAG: lysophospholipid acyltransferase family protein [bacterium]
MIHTHYMRRFFYDKTTVALQKLGYAVFFLAYKIFVSLEIKGKENIKHLTGPIILAANHTNELDVTSIPLVLPFFSPLYPIFFVMNPIEKFKTFGWRSYIYGTTFLNMLGGYSIYSGYKDYATSLEDHISILKNGGTLCIFPEGKRTRDGNLNPARGGLGFLIHTTGATVVPVVIDTFFNMSVIDFFTRRRKVVITILPPMTKQDIISENIENPSTEDYRGWSQKVMDKIKFALN